MLLANQQPQPQPQPLFLVSPQEEIRRIAMMIIQRVLLSKILQRQLLFIVFNLSLRAYAKCESIHPLLG